MAFGSYQGKGVNVLNLAELTIDEQHSNNVETKLRVRFTWFSDALTASHAEE